MIDQFISEYLGLDELLDGDGTISLLFRLLFVLIAVSIVLKNYVRRYHDTEQVFTYWAFAIVTFSVAFLLRKVPMELGFALGLFAVFGVLRYRTEAIAIKDLTYLFIVIGLSLVNALSNKKVSVAELFIVNAAIAGTVWLRENKRMVRHESSVLVLYDKIPMLAPEHRGELMQDLVSRTGLPVTRYKIQQVDMLRDTAHIMVHFDVGQALPATVDKVESSGTGKEPNAEQGDVLPQAGLEPRVLRT